MTEEKTIWYNRNVKGKEFYITFNVRDKDTTAIVKSIGGKYYFWANKKQGKWYFSKQRFNYIMRVLQDKGYKVVDGEERLQHKEKRNYKYPLTPEQEATLKEIKFKNSYRIDEHRCRGIQIIHATFKYFQYIGRPYTTFKTHSLYRYKYNSKPIYENSPINSSGESGALTRLGREYGLLELVYERSQGNTYKFKDDVTEEKILQIAEDIYKKGFAKDNEIKFVTDHRITNQELRNNRFCSRCGKSIKDRTFHAKYCKDCSEYIRTHHSYLNPKQLWAERNKQHLKEYQKEYREANKKDLAKKSKEYRETHKEELKRKAQIKRQENKILEYHKTCKECLRKFVTDDPKRKYCCDTCYKNFHKASKLASKQRWRDKRRKLGLPYS